MHSPAALPSPSPAPGQRRHHAARLWRLRSGSTLLLAIIAGAVCIGANRAASTAAAPQALQPIDPAVAIVTDDDWPTLAVEFRSPDGDGYLEYTHAREWTVRSRGSVMTFSGTTLTQHIANTTSATGESPTYQEELQDGVAMPARWLHPRFAAALLARNYVVTPGRAPQTAQFQMRWTVPCPPQAPHPAPCAVADAETYTELETYLFRTDITPPLAILGTSEIDGETTVLFEVLSVEPLAAP